MHQAESEREAEPRPRGAGEQVQQARNHDRRRNGDFHGTHRDGHGARRG